MAVVAVTVGDAVAVVAVRVAVAVAVQVDGSPAGSVNRFCYCL